MQLPAAKGAEPAGGAAAPSWLFAVRQFAPARSAIAIAVLAAAIGFAYAYLVVGPRVLNPFNVSWLAGDPITYYLGWSFFRQEEHLTLPLGWSASLGYPFGEPIAYLDTIPLVAVLFWPFRHALPDSFQFMGLYFVVCCALQFYFGFRISRRLCGGDRLGGVLGALLFLTAPIFTWRANGHFPLLSQWLILAAMDQFVAAPDGPSPRQIVWRTAMCFIAAAINPYIATMTLMVIVASYARGILHQTRALGAAGIGIVGALVAVLVGLELFGFLRSTDASQYIGSGYEYFAMNLLDPISPRVYGALVLKQQPNTFGTDYLGLGLILLGIVTVARKPSALRYLFSREGLPALALFACSLLLALSTRAALGTHVIYHLALPQPVMSALASLRASERLFWPACYLLFAGSIWLAAQSFRRPSLYAVLAVTVLVQFLDTAPLRGYIHQLTASASSPPMPPEQAWRDLGRTQQHLVVVPPWQCDTDNGPGGAIGYGIFGRVALDQHMTINSFYAGRYSATQLHFFCSEQIAQIYSDGLRSDTAYVFAPSMVAWLAGSQLGGKFCRPVGEYVLCSAAAGRSGLDPAILQALPLLHFGDVVDFSGRNATAASMAGAGWSIQESWGRWMEGGTAYLTFRVADQPHTDLQLTMAVLAATFPSHPVQRVEIQANGRQLPRQTVTATNPQLQFTIPADVIGDDGLIRLRFDLPDAVSRTRFGVPSDARQLSIGVQTLRIGRPTETADH
jgi:hypothetical protein